MRLAVAIASLYVFCVPASLQAAPDAVPKRDATSILFETPDWAEAPAGTKISYRYARQTDGSAGYGASFEDSVGLTLEAGGEIANRTIEVQMFSGERRVPAGPFENMSTNPVLLLVFENHLQALSRMFQANPRYLKTAIRKAWRDKATIEDIKVMVGMRAVPGTRVTIQPFRDDPMKDRMKGLEGLTYAVDVADSVPGEIAAIDIHTPDEGPPRYSESLRYQPEKTP